MKKYMKSIMLLTLGLLAFTACTQEEGTEPGNDSTPVSTVFTFEAPLPNNPDNDFIVRVAANADVENVYYHVDKTADIANLSDDAIIQRVMEKGKQVDMEADAYSGGSFKDFLVTDLYGRHTIEVVSAGGDAKTLVKKEVIGLEWADVCTGTYYLADGMADFFGTGSFATTLQVCTTDATLYRFKDLFGEGYSMKINMLDITGSDDDGDYTFFRVPDTATPFEYDEYGGISVRDIGYWQGDASFVTEYGYESGMYEDHSCFVFVQYYVSAGNLGYGYDSFLPD